MGAGVGQGVGLVLSKIGLEHYAAALPADAPQAMTALMPFATLTTFFGPFLGVSLSLMAVQYAEAGIASTLMALTPVLIIAPYAIINHQRVSAKEIFGTLVTIVGVAMFFLL